MHFNLITLFPEMFPGTLAHSLAGDALKSGKWGYSTINLRDFGLGNHKTVDDTPYGGGAGMVIRPDVVGAAVESLPEGKIIYLTPRGKMLTQQKVAELAKLKNISILCGRYEGVDERALKHYQMDEICIGEYVLSGGEPAALVLMDAIIRMIPGVLGNAETHTEESFTNGKIEYPHYTRPAEWNGHKVPDVLASGNHAEIAKWRAKMSDEITNERGN